MSCFFADRQRDVSTPHTSIQSLDRQAERVVPVRTCADVRLRSEGGLDVIAAKVQGRTSRRTEKKRKLGDGKNGSKGTSK